MTFRSPRLPSPTGSTDRALPLALRIAKHMGIDGGCAGGIVDKGAMAIAHNRRAPKWRRGGVCVCGGVGGVGEGAWVRVG